MDTTRSTTAVTGATAGPGREAGHAGRADASGGGAGRRSTADWLLGIPVLLALVLSLVGSGRPLWLDEVATANMSSSPLSRLLTILADIDAVHGVYYVGMHGWTALLGTDPLALRLPSVLATVAATAAVVLIARRLAGTGTALASGTAYALLPIVTDYGMEARSYALGSALVAWSCYWLVRGSQDDRRGSWVVHGTLLALSGGLFLYSLLIIAAQAATLGWARVPRSTWRSFLISSGLAAVVAAPIALLAASQRGQVSWLERTDLQTLVRAPFTWTPPLAGTVNGILLTAAVWAVVAAGVVLWWRQDRDVRGPGVQLPQLALPWLLLPLAVLIAVSVVVPLFVPRYVFLSAPALALLIGHGLVSMRRAWAIGAAGLIVVLCIPALVAGRAGDGRDSVGAKAAVLAQDGQPGDVLMTTPYYYMPVLDEVLGSQFVRVQDSGRNPNPITWVEADESVIGGRLADVDRVWLVPFDDAVEAAEADRLRALIESSSFSLTAEYPAGNATVQLYTREGT